MVDPMKKFSGIFPSLYLALKKREQALQEFGRCTAKVQKYEDKERSGQNLAKLEAVSLIIMLITECSLQTQFHQFTMVQAVSK